MGTKINRGKIIKKVYKKNYQIWAFITEAMRIIHGFSA